MGGSHSTPTLRPKDLEPWNRQGRPVMIEKRRRVRSPSGRTYTETRRRFVRGTPFDDVDLDEGHGGHPTSSLGRGSGYLRSPVPPGIPGLYPDPAGGPDIRVPGGGGSPPQSGRLGVHVFGPPIPLGQFPVFERPSVAVPEEEEEEIGSGYYIPRYNRFEGQNGMPPPFWEPPPPPPFLFSFPGDGFLPRQGGGGASHPSGVFVFADDMIFPPRPGPFNNGGCGPFTTSAGGLRRGRPPFQDDFPDNTSQESWGPVRRRGRGRSPSPGFVVSEDGVPL